MKKIKTLLTQKALLAFIFALSGPQLIASEHQNPKSPTSILTVLATKYDPAKQELRVTCSPEAADTLEKIMFEQQADRWSSTLLAKFGGRQQPIEESSERPLFDTEAFKVYFDETTSHITFGFSSRVQKPESIET